MTPAEAKPLLMAHFANQTNPLQRRIIAEWLQDDAHQELFYAWLVEWENQLPVYQPDTDSALNRFSAYIHTGVAGTEQPQPADIRPVDVPFWSPFLMAAASVLLLLALTGWYNRDRMLYQTYQTVYGQTRTIQLSDGSTVTLNANSTLRLPRFGFGNRSREVRLMGEAFFSVRHQPDNQKFVVRTANGFDVIVHGTEFNVSTYAHRANVMLRTGQVQIDYPAGSTRKQLMLEPGDLVNLNQPGLPQLTRHVQPQVYSAWTENRFVFNDMTLLEFGQLLTDTYGLKVEIPESLTKRTLVGSFQANNADELVQTVAELLDLSVSRKANTVVLEERKSRESD
ncbi:MAG: FecR domain-containing protein [Spirosoma sp.]|nr:FecR domain-containing protein [Spirosoma sp.]